MGGGALRCPPPAPTWRPPERRHRKRLLVRAEFGGYAWSLAGPSPIPGNCAIPTSGQPRTADSALCGRQSGQPQFGGTTDRAGAGRAVRLAVVLFNLGGPDSPDAVEPFLRNLFSDPAVIDLPGFIRRPLASFVARRRAPIAREIYAKIGGRSPSNAQVAWLAVYSPSSTSHTNQRSALKTVDLLEYPRPARSTRD